ncbi:MAG: Inner rane transport permease YbhR [Pseudomonadota bacterium]|jgi:ABC-2 type transport system permease protein
MRNIWAICKRELLAFFVSPIAYFVITGFTLLVGFFFFNHLSYFAQLVEMSAMISLRGRDLPNLNQTVIEGVYHTMVVILVFLIPLLTMRTIAEEKKKGTFELLITSPVSVFQIVLGKFLSIAIVLVIMLSVNLIFPALLIKYGNPEVLPILSGFLGLVLCSLGFASIGMAVSSFTENQVVAGVISMVTLLLLYVIQAPAESLGGTAADVFRYLSPVEQLQDLLRGIITLKSITYFTSLIVIGLFLSQRALEAYRWR